MSTQAASTVTKKGPQQLTIIARMRAKAGQEQRVIETLNAMLDPTRSEPGCITYDLHQSEEDPRDFVFYENWADNTAFHSHTETPYLRALIQNAPQLFDGEIQISRWKMLS